METYRFGKFEITLSAKFTDEYIDKFGIGEMGKFRISVIYNGKRLQFSFYESVKDTMKGKDNLSDYEIVEAFQCFLGDTALVINNSWDKSEIEKEIDEISNEAFAELKRSAKSFLRLFDENDIYELSDSVNEYLDDNY